MGVKLFKKLVVINEAKDDEKRFYTFYLRLENGSELKVMPHTYEDKEGVKHSNYNQLCLIANTELPFDK